MSNDKCRKQTRKPFNQNQIQICKQYENNWSRDQYIHEKLFKWQQREEKQMLAITTGVWASGVKFNTFSAKLRACVDCRRKTFLLANSNSNNDGAYIHTFEQAILMKTSAEEKKQLQLTKRNFPHNHNTRQACRKYNI